MPNQQSNPRIKNLLLTMIIFFKHKAEEKGLKPVITVAKLIDMMRGSGLRLSYQQLVDLSKDPTIAPSIKSINKNQIEFNLGEESTEPTVADVMPPEQEQTEQGGEEEYNPDDFAMPEGNDEEMSQENSGNAMEPEENIRPQQSIISQMAKRAASRPD
jgi:hypothetical protein